MIQSKTMLKVAGLCCVAALAVAQNPVQPQYQSAGPYNGQSGPSTGQPLLSPDQLDNLVAPIALYPDELLSEVLAASTYPLEVVEAQQWMQENRNLSGQALIDAAKQQNWDPSVQGLVAFPDVLTRLNGDIRWTTDLGNAFLAQQADVMNAVQTMRQRAEQSGKLRSTSQETVATENQDGQNAITIAPTDPQVVYVPEYDPVYVWGPPLYGAYPYLWYPPFYAGIGWGPGIYLGNFFGGFLGWGGWGWGFNWFGGGLFLNVGFFNHFGFHGYGWRPGFGGRVAWSHDPGHRMGVAYANRAVAQRFGSGARPGFATSAARSGFGAQRGAARASVGAATRAGNGGFRSFSGSNAGSRAPQAAGNRGFSSASRGSGSVAGNRGFSTAPRGSGSVAGNGGFSSAPRGSGSAAGNGGFSSAPRGSGSVAGNVYRGGNSAAGRSFSTAPSRAPSQGYRGFSGGSSPTGRSFAASPRAPQNGGFSSAPRSFNGGSRPSAPSRSFSAPPSRSFSAPRSSGGGGGSRSFSAPRSSGGGGGGSRGGGGGSHGGRR